MKALKYIFLSICVIAFLIIALFSIALLLNNSFGQFTIFILIATSLIYWPNSLFSLSHNKWILFSRISFIVILISLKMFVFKSEPKTSIYTSQENKSELMRIYKQQLSQWPEDTEDIYTKTKYGQVHVLACGSKKNPPLLMLHAASMGAHSWAENLDVLIKDYRIYAIDNIGEGNRSELTDASKYPNTQKEIADLYAFITENLGVDKSPVFGASNGGYIAQSYAYYYPEKVQSLVLFGPMGLTQLSNKSIFMLSFASLYPIQCVRNFVSKWAIGEDELVNHQYGEWFNSIMKGTIPSVAQPIPMTKDQKQNMHLPILLFLGTKDPIVGDAINAKDIALDYPDIQN